jgi:uncharacterized protein YbjT (DUF2867 family)
MKILIFGATGMVGQGVLRECLKSADVEIVLVVGRTATGLAHAKLQEIVVPDLFDVTGYSGRISGSYSAWDACFFCLGVSSAGMTEADYTHMTYDLTLGVAETLVKFNPRMTFVYVSGQGTDSSEHGRAMWARVKGRLENALLRLPFRAAYMFRPGFILPLDGIQSKTKSYRILYGIVRPLSPLLHRTLPNQVLTTAEVGKAMLAVARRGAPKQILEVRDLRTLLTD